MGVRVERFYGMRARPAFSAHCLSNRVVSTARADLPLPILSDGAEFRLGFLGVKRRASKSPLMNETSLSRLFCYLLSRRARAYTIVFETLRGLDDTRRAEEVRSRI